MDAKKKVPMYKSIGYYNGVDAIRLRNKSANEVIKYMREGKGNFHKCDEVYVDEGEYFITNHYAKYSKDKSYIVLYDVADRFDNMPIKEVTDEIAKDEFIDIYKKIGK